MSVPGLVGITQRVIAVPAHGQRRDALDQSWMSFLAACGLEPLPVPNRHPDPVGYLRRLGACGVILSGGGNISASLGRLDGRVVRLPAIQTDLAPERDVTETLLLHASIQEGWPLIGVCRGMQALNVFHGGGLSPVSGHVGTPHPIALSDGVPGFDSFRFDDQVNSFHDFGIPPESVGVGLSVLADSDGWPEAFLHERFRHLGIMWHPERNRPFSENDIGLFRRFFSSQND